MIKRAAKQGGIERWKDVTPKALRKAFESALRNNRLDLKDQEFLMGHILPGTQDPYYDYSKVEQLREKYLRISFFPNRNHEAEELRKKQVLDTVKLLGFPNDKIKKVEEALAKYADVDEALEEIKKLQMNPHTYEKRNSQVNRRKTQVRIVRGEQRLIGCLNKEWDLIRELSHDRFLLKKRTSISAPITLSELDMD
jgi:hypothetical protein